MPKPIRSINTVRKRMKTDGFFISTMLAAETGHWCAVHKLGGHLLHRIWLLARRDEGAYPQRSVTEEQQSQKPNAAQPDGRHVFLVQTSLFAPYRPLKGMLVAHASSEPKIHCRKCPLNL